MKPILFNTEMVRAILEGRKTVTRRAMKPQPEKSADSPYECIGGRFAFRIGEYACTDQYKPPYRTGDILYVRESWRGQSAHRIDADASIHMPREAARIFLRVTDMSVERLQDIDGHGIFAEGVDNGHSNPTMGKRWENMQLMAFQRLWDSTIKPADHALYGWAANPWVWVIEFEQISREEAETE